MKAHSQRNLMVFIEWYPEKRMGKPRENNKLLTLRHKLRVLILKRFINFLTLQSRNKNPDIQINPSKSKGKIMESSQSIVWPSDRG